MTIDVIALKLNFILTRLLRCVLFKVLVLAELKICIRILKNDLILILCHYLKK